MTSPQRETDEDIARGRESEKEIPGEDTIARQTAEGDIEKANERQRGKGAQTERRRRGRGRESEQTRERERSARTKARKRVSANQGISALEVGLFSEVPA